MTAFRLQISRTAERQLKKLSADAQNRVVRAVQALANEPFPEAAAS